MKKGELVRVTFRDLIYTNRRGGRCIGAADLDEVVLVIDDNEKSHSVKILHPIHGLGFITRYYVEVLSETR